jgi:tetrahydromethanopterin S-methyltransferase subunit G
MSDISRSEFDRLVSRVDRIEQTLKATVEIMAAEVVGLRTSMDEQFKAVNERFDAIEEKLDNNTAQVNAGFHAMDVALARHDRFMSAIANHFGITLEQS